MLELDPRQDRDRFARDAKSTHPIVLAYRNDVVRHHRMKVEMPVGVDVVKRKPCFPIGTKLSFDLRSELCPHRWPRAYVKPKPREVLPQMSACINKIWYSFRRQSWSAVYEHQV